MLLFVVVVAVVVVVIVVVVIIAAVAVVVVVAREINPTKIAATSNLQCCASANTTKANNQQ